MGMRCVSGSMSIITRTQARTVTKATVNGTCMDKGNVQHIYCSGWQACHSAELQERGESYHAHIYGASIWKDGVLVEQACSRVKRQA